MPKTGFLISVLLIAVNASSQSNDPWVRFTDSTSNLSGYKNLKGEEMIAPRFHGFSCADTFYNIIGVSELSGSSFKNYYLLKDGRIIGRDSLYIFDFAVDLESEGKIMFSDRKNDRVGFFDGNGRVVIPAMYNYASPFRNGFSIAHRNAKRACLDGEDLRNCEHPTWEGGETVLINEKNEVLAENVSMELYSVNWHSVRINDPSIDTGLYLSIKGKNNLTYSFIHYDKEFSRWFNNIFLRALEKNSIVPDSLLFPEVTYWSKVRGWTTLTAGDFLRRFPGEITSARFRTSAIRQISIGNAGWAPFMSDSKLLAKYYNANGDQNTSLYPAVEVYITNYKKRQKPLQSGSTEFHKNYDIDFQEGFLFLRTEAGYKLLQANVGNQPE